MGTGGSAMEGTQRRARSHGHGLFVDRLPHAVLCPSVLCTMGRTERATVSLLNCATRTLEPEELRDLQGVLHSGLCIVRRLTSTYAHMHTHAHTRTHTCTHANTHANMHTNRVQPHGHAGRDTDRLSGQDAPRSVLCPFVLCPMRQTKWA